MNRIVLASFFIFMQTLASHAFADDQSMCITMYENASSRAQHWYDIQNSTTLSQSNNIKQLIKLQKTAKYNMANGEYLECIDNAHRMNSVLEALSKE